MELSEIPLQLLRAELHRRREADDSDKWKTRLSETRDWLGMEQYAVADLLGYSQAYVCMCERGARNGAKNLTLLLVEKVLIEPVKAYEVPRE